MVLKDWEKKSSESKYLTWKKIDNRIGNYHSLYLVVKPVENANKGWIVFLSSGYDNGTSIIYRASNKSSALKQAIKYMRSH
jgi:hypothetical protein